PSTTFTDSRTSRSTPPVCGSDTSEDELAGDEVIVKLLRPEPAQQTSSTDCQRDSGQRRVTRPVEFSSERMRHDGKSGWRIRHKGQAMFVPDSQWVSCERNWKDALYCASLNVFIYSPTSRDRR
ncbi:uncharacterized protein A1O9_09457, partial [Exophiala aquamarina CBS 119918]